MVGVNYPHLHVLKRMIRKPRAKRALRWEPLVAFCSTPRTVYTERVVHSSVSPLMIAR